MGNALWYYKMMPTWGFIQDFFFGGGGGGGGGGSPDSHKTKTTCLKLSKFKNLEYQHNSIDITTDWKTLIEEEKPSN